MLDSNQLLDVQPVTIPHSLNGKRVDAALAELFPQWSRVQITHWLKDGAITLDERTYKPKEKVFGGEVIRMNLPVHQADPNTVSVEPENIPLQIEFEDDELLIINKTDNFVVHPGAGNRTHTLMNALLHYHPPLIELPRAGIIHRLDKDTTGLLIVAKTRDTYNAMIRLMQAREIQRRYLALVHGHVISGGTIDTNYGRHPNQRLKMAVTTQGKQAITIYTLNKQYHHSTLLNVNLMTGRTHQIRVHMAHIKHPLVGDRLYGGQTRVPPGLDDELRKSVREFHRQALHACHLSFVHPTTGETLSVSAPIPDDFQTLLNQMETYL